MRRCRRKYDTTGFDGGAFGMIAHLVKSMYAYQIMTWFHYFPRNHFHFVTLEQYIERPLATYERALDFLGLPLYDPAGAAGFQNRTAVLDKLRVLRNVKATKYPELEEEVRGHHHQPPPQADTHSTPNLLFHFSSDLICFLNLRQLDHTLSAGGAGDILPHIQRADRHAGRLQDGLRHSCPQRDRIARSTV
jgi:hypothetical protein